MKKLVLFCLALGLLSTFAFGQAAPKNGEIGIQGSLVFTNVGGTAGDVGVKWFLTDVMALRGALGYQSTSSSGASASFYSLGFGLEYHLASKGGVSPYLGGELSYSGESLSTGGTTPTDFGLLAVFGGEYFFSSNFSWAGEARLGFGSTNLAGTSVTTVGTFGFATALTWYVN